MSAHRLTKTSNKFIGLALALVLAFVGLATVKVPTANAAIAAPSNPYPFQCEAKFYQASNTGFYVYDPAVNQYTKPAGSATSSINGIGYNPIDGYLYGFSDSSSLVRVSSDGKYQAAGTTTGVAASTTGGDFYPGAGDNVLINATSRGDWTATNVATGVVSNFTATGTSWESADFAIKGNYGYGMKGTNLQIATFTPKNGATPASVNVQASVSVTNLESSPGSFGAAYIDTTGDAYFFSNDSGKLYRLTAAQLLAARTNNTSPAATLITTANTLNAPNDGASCSTAPSPFSPPVAAGDNYGVAPNGNFTANTNSTSLLAGDTSGIPLKVKTVTFGGTTLTDGANGATIVSNGVTLTITNWSLGYFTLTGITTGITFTYTAIETATSPGEAGPRTTNTATVKIDPLIITKAPSTLTSAVINTAYTNSMTATGSSASPETYYWTVSPALPAGLSLNSATGAITGTPTSAQSSTTYTFSVGLDSTMKTSVSANYTLAVLSTAPVAPTAQTITFAQPASRAFVANATFVVAPTGGGSGNAVVVTSATPSVCTVSATPTPYTVTLVSTGTCTLNANQDGGTNGGTTYSAATQVSQSFNVGRITTSSLTAGTAGTAYTATITQAGLSAGGTPWAISGVSPSATGLVINSSTGALSWPTPVAGTYDVTVTYTANSITITKTISLVISAASLTPQTITYSYTTPTSVGGPAITVAPTATSNLPVSLSTSSTACSVTGFVITILGPGDCVIDADQPGNGTYAPATRVSSTFTILGITTASLPSGTVGGSYTASIAADGTFGSCTYTTSTTLPSAIVLGSNGTFSGTASNPWSGNIVVTITCVSGGNTQTDTKSFAVSIAGVQQTVVAAPVIPTPPAPEPEPVEAAAPTPSPTPVYTPPAVKPSPSPSPTIITPVIAPPIAAPEPKPTETVLEKIVRFLAGVFEGISTPENNGSKATRSIDNLAGETLTNFAPGAGLRVEVIGSRIAGQFVAAPGDAGDPIALAKAIEESTQRNATNFANITNVVRVGAPNASQVYSSPLTKVEIQLFAAAGLDIPSRASSFISRTDKWVEVTASAQTYLPGTRVYLAVTSSPMIFGAADVGQDGKAMIIGRLPIGALENGGHSIRIVGIRSLDGITADKSGSIKISDATLTEIRKFDNGTKATLIISGNSNGGGLQTLVREIPLERPVQWWTLWFALIVGLISLVYRYYYWRKAGKKQRKAIAITVAALAGVPAAVIGWLDITYELWIGVAVAAVFVLLNVIWKKKDMFENAFDRVRDEVEEKIDEIQADIKRPRRRK